MGKRNKSCCLSYWAFRKPIFGGGGRHLIVDRRFWPNRLPAITLSDLRTTPSTHSLTLNKERIEERRRQGWSSNNKQG
jgi:hypothetical protein